MNYTYTSLQAEIYVISVAAKEIREFSFCTPSVRVPELCLEMKGNFYNIIDADYVYDVVLAQPVLHLFPCTGIKPVHMFLNGIN